MMLMQPALVPLLDDRMSTDGTSGPGASRPPHAPMGLQYRISSGMGFIIEYYLIVINIASVKRKIIKPKYPVACSV